jgi:diguanylate cyclase (GGDEF)-like protein/PAS domain S-box-containing protein
MVFEVRSDDGGMRSGIIRRCRTCLGSGWAPSEKPGTENDNDIAHAHGGHIVQVVTDAMPGLVGYWDRDLRCRFANRSYEEWYGKLPEDIIGTTLHELLGDDLFELNRPYIMGALAGERQQFERTVVRIDGGIRHTLANYIPDIVDGAVMGFTAQVADVTTLKDTEAALRAEIAAREQAHAQLHASAAALEEAQRLGQLGSWEWDPKQDKAIWSKELYRIRGCDPSDPPPKFAEHEFNYVPASWAKLKRAVDHALATGEPYQLELQFMRPDGTPGWLDARGEVTRDERGDIVSLRGTAQDITARKAVETALRKTQDFLERTGTVAGVGGWEVDLETREIVWSPQVCRIHGVEVGYRPDFSEAIGFFEPDSQLLVRQAFAEAIATGKPYELESQIIRPDGEARWVRIVGSVEYGDGQPVRIFGALQDVTVKRRLAMELAEQHEVLRVTLQSIGDAVITTDAAGYITWLNRTAERITEWQASAAIGKPLAEVFHVIDEVNREAIENTVAACLANGGPGGMRNSAVLVSRTGREFGIEESASPIRNEAGEVFGVVLVFHDVSERRRMIGEMAYRAAHDSLTGVINRSEFEIRLSRVFRRAVEDESEHALLYIDLDQFKLINDTCGHMVGDHLLQQVARLLGECVRMSDALARVGGDEFAIILEGCCMEQANLVAQKICDRLDDFRFSHDDKRFRVGASIGVVPVDKRWESTSAIRQAADTACYAAKEAGRNRVHAWIESDAVIRTRLSEAQWTRRIEKALDEDGFVLFGQRLRPLQNSAGGLHAEILLRMRNDDGTLAQPGAFLPAAERFNLATRVDRWVLGHVLAWMSGLDRLDKVECICVNLSGQSIGDRAFHKWAIHALGRAGSTICAKLCLEITETAAVTNQADAAIFVRQVREAGVRVALDDFGAGASSFGYLKSIPVDWLKIDGQFIRNLVDDDLDQAAVKCFVDVAKVMGLQTIAEFVDQPAVLDRLSEIGVDFAQGYLIHRPEPVGCLLASH